MHYTGKQRVRIAPAIRTQLVRGKAAPKTPLNRKVEFMRKRNIQVIVRFNKDEHQHLKKLVKRSGVSQEVYIRHLIDGVIPADMPPPDYFAMIKELHQIGNNLNQIAQKAHVLNVMDVKRYDEAVRALDKSILHITNAVMLPRKIE